MGLANPYYTVITFFFIQFNFNPEKINIDTMKTLFVSSVPIDLFMNTGRNSITFKLFSVPYWVIV